MGFLLLIILYSRVNFLSEYMKRQKLYVPGEAVGEDEKVYLHKGASGTITVIGIGIEVIVLTE